MQKYINGAIKEAMCKGRALMTKIPGARDLGVYFPSLATTANREIEQLIASLDYVYSDPDYNDPINIKEKFTRFKSLSGRLSDIENVVIAAMSRKAADDEFVNKLVFEICNEINYPLPTPVASCLSQKYYHIYPDFNLLCIPLLESEFLLHIPDIYHEICHPLLSLDNPKVEPFQKNLGSFNVEVKKYFDEEIKRRALNTTHKPAFDPIHVWKESWLENWSVELFCDLFATFTLGPAYIWSNIHMCTKLSWEVYRIPTFQKLSHPPDEARMKAIIHALELIGFKTYQPAIQAKWDEFKKIVDQKEPAEFSIALPENLLKLAAEYCLVGIKQIGCELASPTSTGRVNRMLNGAWDQFWKDPDNFHDAEKKALDQFKADIK